MEEDESRSNNNTNTTSDDPSKPSYENSWEEDVNKNLLFLTQNITDLGTVLIGLMQHQIISKNERELIMNQAKLLTSSEGNFQLLTTLKQKGWDKVKPILLKILRDTENFECANKIDKQSFHNVSINETPPKRNIFKSKLDAKWWPEVKTIPKSFYKRQFNNLLLVEELQKLFKSGTAVITQAVAVSGLGGIGKSTTAKWFGKYYEENYDHILWIDCGEQTLMKSFQKLARKLIIKDCGILELQELAIESFNILQNWNCLFIYDNAECYNGPHGIRHVLPKTNYSNFHVLITSRNQYWGIENIDGEIPQLQMNTFSLNEGVEFMRKSLNNYSENEQSKLKLLCNLLGNLPLALQIAVAALNKKKISLIDYIHKIKITKEIINSKVDDYEQTINKTMKVSLDVIHEHEKNEEGLADKILTIFGYITPDDVDSNLFVSIENVKKEEIEVATDLLESYSLLTSQKFDDNLQLLSIHRLLQQVIRYNSKATEEETLRKILSCKDNLEYKLISFSYADIKLQNQFPDLKAEFIQKIELIELLIQKRFQEAVELARLIKSTLDNPIAVFNLAVCLKYNLEIQEAKTLLEGIPYENTSLGYGSYDISPFGILNLSEPLARHILAGQLFMLYCEESDIHEARDVVLNSGGFLLPIAIYSPNGILRFLNKYILSDLPFHHNYFVNCDCDRPLPFICVVVTKEFGRKEMNISGCKIDATAVLPNGLHELNLKHVELMTPIVISLRKLRAEDVLMDLSHLLNIGEASFTRVKILHSKLAKWDVNKLVLQNTDFLKKTEMTITEMNIAGRQFEEANIDISVLPSSIVKLQLHFCNLMNFPNKSNCEKIFPPQLQELKLLSIKVYRKNCQELKDVNITQFCVAEKLEELQVCNSSLSVSLDACLNIKSIHLQRCNLIVPNSKNRLRPTKLVLVEVNFHNEKMKGITEILANDLFDLVYTERLELICNSGLSIDITEPLKVKQVDLKGTRILKCGRKQPEESTFTSVFRPMLHSVWWPEKKTLPIYFLERKVENQLTIAKLASYLSKDIVDSIFNSPTLLISGSCGVGKTVTAIWFALRYQKYYDHIIYVDCNEGNVVNSFKKLAADLKLNILDKMSVYHIAKMCFHVFNHKNCLFIFDNVTWYPFPGKDIYGILCQRFNRIHNTIVISRNNGWVFRSANKKIEMQSFGADESVEFMAKNLEHCPCREKLEVKLLCELLENFPLALQIAVTTINKHNIPLRDHIKAIRKAKLALNVNGDPYDKRMHTTMKVTLDVIKEKEGNIGRNAHQILNIFGYITPYNIDSDWFISLESLNELEMMEATTLLETYLLITTGKKFGHNYTLSINPLLQPGIRYNNRYLMTETLRKIFNRSSNLEYKLLPFCLANETLHNEFPEIKTAVIEKMELVQLLEQERLLEAVVLARFINEEINIPIAAFNLAICLKRNSEMEQAKNIFANLYTQGQHNNNFEKNYDCYFSRWGTVANINEVLTKEVIAAQLILLYALQNKVEAIATIAQESKRLIFPDISDADIIRIIQLLPPTLKYTRHHYHHSSIQKHISLSFDN